MDADLLLFPSITFCPVEIINKVNKVPENITADYEALPKLEEMIAFAGQKYIRDNKYVIAALHCTRKRLSVSNHLVVSDRNRFFTETPKTETGQFK